MTTEGTEARIREARLIVARPEQVLTELEKYGDELKSRYRDENLERSLLARNEPLIDLGLARYAQEKGVVASLYQKSRAKPADHLQERYLLGLRIACLSNENEVMPMFSKFPEGIIGEQEFARLITEGDEEELDAIFSNPNLADETLEALYKNEGLFATLPDERRCNLVYLSSYNPRLITNKDSEFGPDLGYWHIHRAFITMLASVPPTEYWLSTLRRLLDRFDPGDLPAPDEPITPILERWAQAPASERKKSNDGYYTALSKRDEFRCLIAAIYGRHYHREEDDKYTWSDLGRPDSPDVVLRCAYYGKAKLTEKEMEDGFFRDEDVYLLAALCNDSVCYKPALRKLLEEEQLHGDLRHVYRRRCEQIHRRRPAFDPRPVSEWLIEEYPSESKEMAMLKQLGTRVASIDSAIKSVQTWISWGFVVVGTLVLLRGH